MFTGIIKKTAIIQSVTPTKGGMLLAIKKPAGWKVRIGDSITVNGVCSTVKKLKPYIVFEYMPESLDRSALRTLDKGDVVNLEQSITLQDRLDGHIVQGHVDTTGEITDVTLEGNSRIFSVVVRDKKYHPFIAEKGSIAIDGISLTLVDAQKGLFTVKIIPFTWEETNMHARKKGDMVNIECDVIAKYLYNFIEADKRR